MAHLSIAADTGAFREASAWLAESGARLGVPDEGLHRLDLCLNEALANIVTHGGTREAIDLCIDNVVRLGAVDTCITITDQGRHFDAAHAIAKARPASLLDAEPGGLGLLMIQSFSDLLEYERVGPQNRLRFGVRWTPAHPA